VITKLFKNDVRKMRKACQFAASLLDLVEKEIKPGVSTLYINNIIDQATQAFGATSAPMGYKGFPKHCCISVNNVVCHGIPSEDEILKDGDIVNVDVTPILKRFHGDTSRTFLVGNVSEEAKKLVDATREALNIGIAAARTGGDIQDIGIAIEAYIEPLGFSIVRDYCGHGIGRQFHMDPVVPHYKATKPIRKLELGLVFTIEPMINIGGWETELDQDDKWTVRTLDGSLSAQFEHTVIVTQEGVEVLTLCDNGKG